MIHMQKRKKNFLYKTTKFWNYDRDFETTLSFSGTKKTLCYFEDKTKNEIVGKVTSAKQRVNKQTGSASDTIALSN